MNKIIACYFLLTSVTPAFADDVVLITAKEFKEYAHHSMGTMNYYEFSGVDDGKAILIHHQMSVINKQWNQTQYWVPSSELSKEYIQNLYNNKK